MIPLLINPPADPLTPSNVADLARDCHADSVSKGWWEPLGDATQEAAREAMRADLIGSEVGEALDALRRPERPMAYLDDKGKPDGYLVEVADVAIRALDLLGRLGSRMTTMMLERSIGYGHYNSFSRDTVFKWQHQVWHVLTRIVGPHSEFQTALLCSMIVFRCAEETARHNADLLHLIQIKRDFNRTRPTRHGGLSL